MENEAGTNATLLQAVRWNEAGLIPVIAQDEASNEVLMLAWMNEDSLRETLATGQMCYWSRSRRSLWRKGETSGNRQLMRSLTLDCDGDTILAKVHQHGPACHTGSRTCFFTPFSNEFAE